MSVTRFQAFKSAWDATYRVPGQGEHKGSNEFAAYRNKASTRLLTFLGLSLRYRKDKSFSGRDVASIVFNVVMFVPNLAKNLVKLVTEFLPLAAYVAAKNKCDESGVKNNRPKFFAFKALQGLAFGLHFIGRAITSPSRGVRKAYALGVGKPQETTRLKRAAGIGLGVLSGLITAAAYAVALPVILTVAAPSVLAAGAALVAKSAVATAAVKGFAVVGSLLTTALQAVGIASIPAAVVGVSSLAATAATAGCAVASEVDIRVKGSTAKIKQFIPSGHSEGVVHGSTKEVSQTEENVRYQAGVPAASEILGNNENQDESSSSYSSGSSVYPPYPPVDQSSGENSLSNRL